MSCDVITDTACIVPNTACIPWDQSRGTKKKDQTERELQDSVKPIGGYFVVKLRVEWGVWFTDCVVNRGNGAV